MSLGLREIGLNPYQYDSLIESGAGAVRDEAGTIRWGTALVVRPSFAARFCLFCFRFGLGCVGRAWWV